MLLAMTKTWVLTVTRIILAFPCVQMTLSLNSRSILWKIFLLRMSINHARRFTPARSPEVSTTLIRLLVFPDPPELGAWVHCLATGCVKCDIRISLYYCRDAVMFILLEVSEHLFALISKGSFRGFLQNTKFSYVASDLDA